MGYPSQQEIVSYRYVAWVSQESGSDERGRVGRNDLPFKTAQVALAALAPLANQGNACLMVGEGAFTNVVLPAVSGSSSGSISFASMGGGMTVAMRLTANTIMGPGDPKSVISVTTAGFNLTALGSRLGTVLSSGASVVNLEDCKTDIISGVVATAEIRRGYTAGIGITDFTAITLSDTSANSIDLSDAGSANTTLTNVYTPELIVTTVGGTHVWTNVTSPSVILDVGAAAGTNPAIINPVMIGTLAFDGAGSTADVYGGIIPSTTSGAGTIDPAGTAAPGTYP